MPESTGSTPWREGDDAHGIVRKGFTAKIVERGLEKLQAVISAGSFDRQNDSVHAEGAITRSFERNPVVLWAHDHGCPPIGKAEVWRHRRELRADIEFAPTPFAQEIKSLYEGGFLNAFSIGFLPRKVKPNAHGGLDFLEWELLEVSCVPVPAQPAALVLGKAFSSLWNAARRADPLDQALADVRNSAAEQWLAEALDEWKMANADPAAAFLSLSRSEKREVVRDAIWPAFAQAWAAATGRLPG